MQYIDHYLTIDMLRERVPDTTWVRAAGIGHRLHVKLSAGPETVLLPGEDEGLVQFVYEKPDGVKSDVAMAVNEFRASVVIPRAAVDTVGIVKCEIRVYDSTAGTWWTSPKFTLTVQDVVYDEAAQTEIVSDPTVLEAILGTEATRIANELERQQAEAQRILNEGLRQDAEEEREDYIDELKDAVARGEFDGKDGVDGAPGEKGEKGDTGAQGPKGDKGDPGSSGGGNVYYGSCDTAAATATKEVDVPPDFVKADGVVLNILFKYANSSSTAPQIRINGGTAESICYYADGGSVVTATDAVWEAKSVLQLTYRNNHWVLMPGVRAGVNRYGITKLSNSTSSTSETQAATSKAVKAAYDKAEAADTKATAAEAACVEKTGTFTPAFTPTAASYMDIKQIGKIVYISGALMTDSDWGTVLQSNHLGDITGVDGPASATTIPIESYDGTNIHMGSVSTVFGYVAANVIGTDNAILINGFYFTA